MQTVVEIHFVLAFLVALCAVLFTWSALGRRVMSAVLGLQVLAGLAVAAVLGMRHLPLPRGAAEHIGLAIIALILYGAASRVGKRSGGGALALSIAGLLVVAATIDLGLRMTAGLQPF